MPNADVVVIGGGVMGLSAALQLVSRGAGRVALLERRFPGAGSSGKSGAILRQHYSHVQTIRMARDSLKEFASYQERTGRDIGFVRTGMLLLAPAADGDAMQHNVDLQRSEGVRTSLLDATALHDLEPRGRFDDVVGAWEPDAGHVDPVRTVGAFAEEAAAHGVEIHLGCEVQRLVTDGSTTARVTGVDTNQGHFATRMVVAATGPWSSRLLEPLRVRPPLDVVRPEQAFLRPPTSFGGDHTIYADLPHEVYYKPESTGTRVGSISYDNDEHVADPDHYDESVSHEFLEQARERVARRLPGYNDAILWGGGSALYTVTPDGQAVIGPLPGLDGFVLVTGFSGHGFKLSPAVGRGVAELIVDGASKTVDLDFFRPDRFERDAGIDTAYRFKILG